MRQHGIATKKVVCKDSLVQILAPPLARCATWVKSLYLLMPQFPHMQNGNNICFRELV